MASKLPYVAYPSGIVKIFKKVKTAKTPDRFTHDFLATKLGFKGGNYRQFIPLAKKLGMLNSDGTPSNLYKAFRNPDRSGAAMADALRKGYGEIFERNEYAHELDRAKLKGLVVEITGKESKDRVVGLICQTFESLRDMADFDAAQVNEEGQPPPSPQPETPAGDGRDFDLNLSYTINLVLPKTDDPAVFNAIFRSLRENLLRR